MVRELVISAIVATLYIILSLAIQPLSFGQIQFRIGEILMVLPFINKKYSYALVLGCLIVNLFSPLALVDVFFGTFSTLLMCVCISRVKNIWLVPIIAAFLTGTMIGYELYLVYQLPLLLTILSVGAGELVVVVIGVIIFNIIEKENKYIYNLIKEM